MPCPQTLTTNESTDRWRELLFCFAVATAAAWLTTIFREPLGGRRAEDYLELGKALYSTGSFESILRPPGYVAFLALVTFADTSILAENYLTIFLVQGVLHGITTAIIREEIGWLVRGHAPRHVTLTFGLSPVALIGAGYLHYDVLHVFLLVLTAAAGRRALADGSRPRDSVLAGVTAATLALVRPMTLPWPLMLLGLALIVHKGRRRESLLRAAFLLMGFALTLVPYAVHNFHKTGRLILVNAQAGAALWPMTEVELRPRSDEFPWARLWYQRGAPIVAANAPELASAGDPFLTETLATNDLFLRRFYENLAENPMRYVRNIGRNAWFFLTGDQRREVQFFRFAQEDAKLLLHPIRRFLVAASEVLVVLTGLFGLVYCLVQRRSSCLAAGSLLICLWLVHSALYLDHRYLYVRAPLCILITGIALFGTEEPKQAWLRKAMAIIPGVLFTSSLVAFVATFL